MSRVGSFVLGFAVGGASVLGGLKYHVLRTEKGVEFVPKLSATFTDTYLDVRHFGVSDWTNHKAVMAAVVKDNKQHLLKDAAADGVVDAVGGMLQELGFSRDGS